MRRFATLIMVLALLLAGFYVLSNAEKGRVGHGDISSKAQVSESIVITSEQDFENGTLENINTTSNPGDIVLEKEYFTYTIGQLDSPDSALSGGYTFLPGDSDYVFRSDGTVTKIKINVGSYNAPFKVKILRNQGGSNFYAVASTLDLSPSANTVNEFDVNLRVKEGDRLGIYTEGSLSAFASTGDNGYWWHFGEVQGDAVSMDWDNSPYVVTMQATVLGERYIHDGNWTSQVYELPNVPSRLSLSWDATILDGTSVDMYVRTSSDGSIWGDWQEVQNGDLVSNPQKYVMVRAHLKGTDSLTPVIHSITINYDYAINGLVINEISSYGSGNSEWVEIYNSGPDRDISTLEIDDQDGNTYTVPSNIGTMPHGAYLTIYFGSGTDDLDFSDGSASVYANFGGDVLNDLGDDVVLKIGGNPIDYVAFWSGGFADVDAPPSGLNFTRDGSGYNGYPPAPQSGQSLSLIPNGFDDDRASEWYIAPSSSTTPGAKNVNLLRVGAWDIAPSQGRQYSTVAVIQLNLSAEGNTGEFVGINSLKLIRNGTATDYDVPTAYLYDDDGDGRFTSSDTMQAQASFQNGTANFSTSIGVNCGSSAIYFIAVKISDNANTSAYANFTLSDISVGGNDLYSFSPITSGNVNIIQRDQTPPYVRDLEFDPSPPLSAGSFNVTIYFSEDMNTSKVLNVSFGVGGYENMVSGYWIGDMVWEGSGYITSSTSNGELRLIVEDGEDLAGNIMSPNPYVTTFTVDTKAPEVVSVDYGGKQPFSLGNYPVTITFSEDMDTSSNPTVKFGITRTNYVTGSWQDSRTWVGNIDIDSYSEDGKNTLYVSGAKDLAGNTMVEYTSYFYVDTTTPYVDSVIFNSSQPFGPGEYQISVYFSESMNTSVQPEVSFGVTHTYYVNGQWVNDEEWVGSFAITADMDNGNNSLLIRNALDTAGNEMSYYYGWFIVDTKKPGIASVDMGNRPAYRAGSYTVTIVFDEAMDTKVALNVTYGRENRTASGFWISNTTWQGTVVVDTSMQNGIARVYVQGGKDIAGNEMLPYDEFRFEVDTVKPTANITMSPNGPYGENSTINIRIAFSEEVKSPVVLLDGVPVNATPQDVGDYCSVYTLTLYGYSLSEGEHRVVVRGAADIAGNRMDDYYGPKFTVDKTPPSVELSYQYTYVEGDSIKIFIHAEDSLTNITSVTLHYVYSSGREGDVEAEYDGAGNYVARIDNAETGDLQFEVIVRDSAGNIAKENGRIEVQTFFMSMLWLWISLAVVAAVSIAVLMIHMRRRRMKGLPALGLMERFKKEPDEEEEFYEE